MMALARRIVSGEEDDAETVEDVLAQARDAEATAEELLVDDGWKVVEIEPESIGFNGNGNGNGRHDPIEIGPTAGLFPVNGNGNHDQEATESQRTLFSWAEFMTEEPVRPNGRKRKPRPATISMFEWALNLERELEAEPVGAGR